MRWTVRRGARRRRSSLNVLAIVMMGVGATAVSTATATPAVADCSVSVAADVVSAKNVATACGRSVEVLAERTETNRVFVEPSGVGRLEAAVVPQRVHRQDGGWADIDTTLRADHGGYAPVASTADLRFSAGGTGPLVTWREGTSTFELSWPGVLPAPRVEGDTAVYPEVLSGVDLHVTADRAGFRHVLVVRTPQAAASPALRQIRYRLGGDMRVTRTAEGGLNLADRAGTPLVQAAPALMWDSRGATGAAGPATASDAHHPGDLATSAKVGVAVSGNDLLLTPDTRLLAAPAAAFPLFIDPTFTKQRSKWAYATNNGENNDTTAARVGLNPASGALYRSYFSFDTSTITGTTLFTAQVTMVLDHSYSCDPTWVHLYRTNSWSAASGSRLSWSAAPLGSAAVWLDSWAGNANESGGCGSNQPDADALFENDALLTDLKAQTASNSSYWVGLCACNQTNGYESSQDRWKKFYTDKTYLVVTYDLKPVAPVGLAFTTTADCYLQCTSPAMVRNLRPTLRAQVQDPYGGTLDTYFEIRTAADLAAPIVAGTSVMPVSTVSVTGNATAVASSQVPAGLLTTGTTYYWHATTKDSSGLWSGWGDWYSFTVDTAPPVISSVVSSQYPAKTWGATVGSPGIFTPNASGADEVTWNVDSEAPTTTNQVSFGYTPYLDMMHVLHITAKDRAGNVSTTFHHEFWASPATNGYTQWRFDESDPAKTTADTGWGFSAPRNGQLAGSAHFVPGYRGNAVHFSGTTGDQVTMGGPVVDTTKSFTVMAWVRASDLAAGTEQTIIAQSGATADRFQLQYRQDANGGMGGWCFNATTDSSGKGRVSACANGQTVGLPTNNTWVHLTGRYDQATGVLRVTVTSDPQSCASETVVVSAPTPWSATGMFAFGRGLSGGVATSYWRGDVDDSRAFQRLLSDSEICQQAAQ